MEHGLTGILNRILSVNEARLPRISNELEKAVLIEDLQAELYHADRTRMSSTGIRKMYHSPRKFLSFWSELDAEDEDEEADHFRIGRAAHLLLLEPQKFKEMYVIEPVHQGLTKEGKLTTSANALSVQQAKAAWRAQQKPGSLLVTQEELDDLVGMMEAVLEHPVANGMLRDGKPECTLHWTDEETGVMCKGRPDYIVNDKQGNIHLIDFKTTRDIRPGIFADDAYRMRYYVQLAFYHDGLVRVMGRQPSSITIIAVEKKPPFEAVVYPLEDAWFEKGQIAYRHALRLYRKCRDTGKWPAYQQNAQLLSMPRKAEYESLPEFSFE